MNLEKPTKDTRKKHVFVVVTATQGLVYTNCAESLMRNIVDLGKRGIEVTPYFHGGDCYISRARSLCSRLFMQRDDFTDMIFVDSDVGFDSDAMWKLLRHDVDFVCGVYPYRSDIKPGYPCLYHQMPDGTPFVDWEKMLIMAISVPAGFMRLTRAVFTRLDGFYENQFTDNTGTSHWFDGGLQFVASGDRTWYGEDNCFCIRYRAAGGAIWIEPDITFTHTGVKVWDGNFSKHLQSLPKPVVDSKKIKEFTVEVYA